MKTIQTFILLLITIGAAHGQVIGVPGDYSSIQAAMNAASRGDTILVEEGLYMENINFKGKAITVASRFILDGNSSHISKTLINGGQPAHPDSASAVIMCSDEDTCSVLMGFTITGGKGSNVLACWNEAELIDLAGGGICIVNAGAKVCNNIIEKNMIQGKNPDYILGGGIYANINHRHTVIIRENIIKNNYLIGWHASGAGLSLVGGQVIIEGNFILGNTIQTNGNPRGSGLNWVASTSPGVIHKVIIRNNIISGNTGYSSARHPRYGGSVALTANTKGLPVLFYNNILSGNYTDSYGGGLDIVHSRAILYNNTIMNNEARQGGNSLFISGLSDVVMYNSIVWSEARNEMQDIEVFNGEGHFLQAYYNILKKPFCGEEDVKSEFNSFLNPGNMDHSSFTLLDSNPAIGRGIDSIKLGGVWYFAPKTDIAGNLRPNPTDPYVDVGARESKFDRVLTSNANLAAIEQSGCRLNPSFCCDTLSYVMYIPENLHTLSLLKGKAQDVGAEIRVINAKDPHSEISADRWATIQVTSQDGTSKKSYKIEYKPLSTQAILEELILGRGELEPPFDPAIYSYEVKLPAGSTVTPVITAKALEPATAEIYTAWDITDEHEAYRSSVVTVTSVFGEPYVTKYKVLFNVEEEDIVEGLEEEKLTEAFKLYPNPFKTEITLEWECGRVLHKIEILNALGQTLRTIKPQSGSSLIIPRDNLPSGIYFIRVFSDDMMVFKVMTE